jgi:RNA polymerase sigma factor (sigma-70 family)
MNLHFSYKSGKTPELEKEIDQNVRKLERFLHAFRPDLVHLHGAIGNGPPNSYSVSLNLRLPTGQLSAQEATTTPVAAAKTAFSDLLTQLKRHKDLLRSEHKWRRRPGGKGTVTSLEEQTPRAAQHLTGQQMEETPRDAEVNAAAFDGEAKNLYDSDVRQYINANLSRLERYVERELRARENNGQIQPGSLTREEVVDEAVLAALSTDQKPGSIPLERWVYRLAIQAIQRLNANGEAGDEEFLALEQNMGEQNVTGSDEEHLQYHQPGETLHREDIIPDIARGNPEELASNDELVDQLEIALRGAEPSAREAFILYVIEGFTLKEISEITGTSAPEVRQSVVAARDHLFKKLPPGNLIKKKILQHSNVA